MYAVLSTICVITTSLLFLVAYLYLTNRKEFKRAGKMRNDFMAMMIHELRSPLSLVKSSANMLLCESERLSKEQTISMLKQIEGSANDLLEIVNDLLDVSKIESGRVEIFKHDTNIIDLLKAEVFAYQNLAEKKKIHLKLFTDEDSIHVYCDNEKMKHVMNNLLSNAIKFTEEGEINVLVKPFPEYVQVTVADTGIGIADNLKPQLFRKFVQARELPVAREKGTGLGLVIVKGIVEAHGGKVWIENNSPRGAKLIFTLPRE